MQVTEKPVRLPKLIVLATLPENKDSIEEWDLDGGGLELNLEDFAPAERPGMETALGLFSGLTPFQRGLVQDGLLQAYEGTHARRVAFYDLTHDYAIEGTGIEIKNRSVDEEGRRGPMEFIFSQSAG